MTHFCVDPLQVLTPLFLLHLPSEMLIAFNLDCVSLRLFCGEDSPMHYVAIPFKKLH